MYEHKRQPLASRQVYKKRILINLGYALSVLAFSLGIGIIGYHSFANQEWLDALHNAAMILSGMGPVMEDPTKIPAIGKVFSSIYALFSGVIFITTIGLILAPAVHRFFHRLHLEDN
ncbi:MAG: hypothetical protein IPP79_07935 [Chitinophagaceae bacterium]|nr:hypothetical protein [Chitinophagaceae bacterium]